MRAVVEEVLRQEIAVHPRCSRDHIGLHDIWTGAAHIIGKVIINGKEYEFDKVVDIEFEKPERRA